MTNPLNSNVTVETFIGSAPVAEVAFGNLLLLTEPGEATFTDDFREYQNYLEASADATLSAGLLTKLATIFSQTHRPYKAIIAKPPQPNSVTVTFTGSALAVPVNLAYIYYYIKAASQANSVSSTFIPVAADTPTDMAGDLVAALAAESAWLTASNVAGVVTLTLVSATDYFEAVSVSIDGDDGVYVTVSDSATPATFDATFSTTADYNVANTTTITALFADATTVELAVTSAGLANVALHLKDLLTTNHTSGNLPDGAEGLLAAQITASKLRFISASENQLVGLAITNTVTALAPTLAVVATTNKTAQVAAILASTAEFYVVASTIFGQCILPYATTLAASKKQTCMVIGAINDTATDYTAVSTLALPAVSCWWYDGTTDKSLVQGAIAATLCNPDPGSATSTVAYKKLTGIAQDNTITSTWKTNLETANIGMYAGIRGQAVLWKGFNLDGTYYDIQKTIHWAEARIAEAVTSLLIDISNRGGKIPYTDAGIQQIAAAIDAVLKTGVRVGHFAEILNDQGRKTSPLVSPPRRADVSDADVAARLVRIPYTATTAGAIQLVIVNSYITTI